MEKFKNILKGKIVRTTSEAVVSGFFNAFPAFLCADCGEQVSVPARCWGNDVPGYWMAGECRACVEAKRKSGETTAVALSKEKPEKMFIVILPGRMRPRITESQRNQMVSEFNAGKKAVIIGEYLFDRLYPIVPETDFEFQNKSND